MTEKKLQKGSQYEHLDIDNNGIITDGEMAIAQKMEQLQHQREMNQNLDKMQDHGLYGVVCCCYDDSFD